MKIPKFEILNSVDDVSDDVIADWMTGQALFCREVTFFV